MCSSQSTYFPLKMYPMIFLFLRRPSTVLTSVSEREFIEGRRRALGRFINLVARHPFFSEDELVKTFLTFSGSVRGAFATRCCLALRLLHNKHYRHDDWQWNASCSSYSVSFSTHTLLTPLPTQDVQTKLRDTYKKTGDEFMTNRIATLAKVCHVNGGKKNPKYSHLTRCLLRAVLSLLCRNISPPTSRLSSQQAESWLEIFTTASKSCGTEPRKWRSARRRTQLISSCLAKSSGISLLWM